MTRKDRSEDPNMEEKKTVQGWMGGRERPGRSPRGRASDDRGKENAVHLMMRADLALKMGSYGDAADLARRLLASDPDHVGALETLARALWRAGCYEDLLPVVRRLLGVNPYEPGYHALRGAALQCLGRYGEAIRAFERAEGDLGAEEALRELESWQADLIADLVRTDPVFRVEFRRDPVAACANRGFGLRTNVGGSSWVGRKGDRATLVARPS